MGMLFILFTEGCPDLWFARQQPGETNRNRRLHSHTLPGLFRDLVLKLQAQGLTLVLSQLLFESKERIQEFMKRVNF